MDRGAWWAMVCRVTKSWTRFMHARWVGSGEDAKRKAHAHLRAVPSPRDQDVTQERFSSVQLLSCPTLCDPMNRSTPGSSVHRNSPGKNTRAGCHFLLPFEHSSIDLTSKLNFTTEIISGYKFRKALPSIYILS